MRRNIQTFLVVIIGCMFCSGCLLRSWKSSNYQHLERAEKFTSEEKYAEAIAEYRAHMEYRLKVKNRADWENPYFYLLTIGDLLLRQNKEAEALSTYEEAEKNGVEIMLVADRYRYVASWHEKAGRLREAIQILTKYRERDELLFDVTLDRLAKELTLLEDLAPVVSFTPHSQ